MPVDLSVDVRFNVTVPRTPEIMAWMREAMRRSVAHVQRRAKDNLSGRFLRVRSGRGLASLRTSVRESRDQLVGKVGSPVFYLRILHQGFPAQTLTTRKTGFRIIGPGGEIIRTKSIQHPGVAPRPWLQVAMEESKDDIVAAFNEVPANIARFIRGRAA